jgi:hypothetical protein
VATGAGISGVGGDVQISGTSVAEVRKWSFNPKATTPQYNSNKTGGYKRSVAGVKSGTGTLDVVHSPAAPLWTTIAEGTSATLSLLFYNAATAPAWAGTSAAVWTVPSVIGDIKYDVDIDNGEFIGGSANFVTNGAWTQPSSGMMLPPGFLPLQDGSAPKEAIPMISQEGLGMLSDEQLAIHAQRIAFLMQAKGLKLPSWSPTPSESLAVTAV